MCVLFAFSHIYSICILRIHFSRVCLFAVDSQQAYRFQKLWAIDNIEKARVIPSKKAVLRLQLITYLLRCAQKCQQHDSAKIIQAKSGIQPFVCALLNRISLDIIYQTKKRKKESAREREKANSRVAFLISHAAQKFAM